MTAEPSNEANAMTRWPNVTIHLMHYVARSKGARVIVTHLFEGRERHIVSSASREGMTVDDPEIRTFLAWARAYYEGAAFDEVRQP